MGKWRDGRKGQAKACPTKARALACLGKVLHIRRDADAKYRGGAFQLAAEEVCHPEEKYLLLAVFFVNDGVLVLEVIERLGQLEGVFGYVRRLAGGYRPFHGGISL